MSAFYSSGMAKSAPHHENSEIELLSPDTKDSTYPTKAVNVLSSALDESEAPNLPLIKGWRREPRVLRSKFTIFSVLCQNIAVILPPLAFFGKLP